MKSRVLAKVEQRHGEWTASAFQGDEVFCHAFGSSGELALCNLKTNIGAFLDTEGRAYLQQWQYAGEATPNCPEGAVKLPIDLWVCKLVQDRCPIQAQVFIGNPDQFFRHCLAPEARKRHIFDTVSQRRYDGFHHIVGRYLCPYCEAENKKASFRYHYPWELACLETYSSFVFEKDWPHIRSTLKRKGLNPFSAFEALCASHSKLVAEILDALLASRLVVLEFDFGRPATLSTADTDV
jgi:hypothetical protein